jgi:glucosamine 6-phosphate synthetase-like amidotransferase/phosphosugar isomerase protein
MRIPQATAVRSGASLMPGMKADSCGAALGGEMQRSHERSAGKVRLHYGQRSDMPTEVHVGVAHARAAFVK